MGSRRDRPVALDIGTIGYALSFKESEEEKTRISGRVSSSAGWLAGVPTTSVTSIMPTGRPLASMTGSSLIFRSARISSALDVRAPAATRAHVVVITSPMGRSPEFWIGSSAICLSLGIIHLVGLKQKWASL